MAALPIPLALVLLASTAIAATPRWLADLNRTDPNSLCIAQQRLSSRPLDVAAFDLWNFYDESVRASQDQLEGIGAGVDEQQLASALRLKGSERSAALARFPTVRDRIQRWERCGYVVMANFDDTPILNPDPVFLRALEPRLGPEVRAYVELYLRESPDWLDYDGALALPLDRLRSRIGHWETFRDNSPAFPPLTAHIERQLHKMFQIYLCGMVNSPLYDDHRAIADFARSSYQQFLRINTKSHQYTLMQEAVANLTKHGWHLNPELIRLYNSRGFAFDPPE